MTRLGSPEFPGLSDDLIIVHHVFLVLDSNPDRQKPQARDEFHMQVEIQLLLKAYGRIILAVRRPFPTQMLCHKLRAFS